MGTPSRPQRPDVSAEVDEGASASASSAPRLPFSTGSGPAAAFVPLAPPQEPLAQEGTIARTI